MRIRSLFGQLLLVACMVLTSVGTLKADVINVDVSGVDPRFRDLFVGAEAFWESRIQDWSEDLPLGLRRNLQPLQITASTGQIDGVGGAVGGAAVTSTATWQSSGFFGTRNYAVPQTAFMQFDLADLDSFDPTDPFALTRADFSDTIIHEMGHAMGFGSLWAENDFLGASLGGATQYTFDGHALEQYRRESGNPFAQFVPIEQQGGGGTALAHWDSNDRFFNQLDTTGRTETMLGFIFNTDSNGNIINGIDFVSETTWGQMADTGWEVQGINDNTGGTDVFGPAFPKPRLPGGPIFFQSVEQCSRTWLRYCSGGLWLDWLRATT